MTIITGAHTTRTLFFEIDDPLTAELERAVDDGTLSFEEYSQYLSEQPYEVRAPLIRFELDCNAYVMLQHPAAHLHIGMHTQNRWPVARALTPRAFGLLVAKLYYSAEWSLQGSMPMDEEGYENRFDRQFVAEKQDCSLLGAHLFDEKEKASLHLA